MSENIYYVNGKFLPASQAVIPADDLAVLRGYGVFDFLKTYGGKPFLLEEHLNRLKTSANLVGISLPWSKEKLAGIILDTLAKNNFPESNIRVVVTGGYSENSFTYENKPGLIVIVKPVVIYPKSCYIKGVKVATCKQERIYPEAKTINYMAGSAALKKAKQNDPEIMELLYLNNQNFVTEGITSNLFAFLGDTLVTPGENVLQGVTCSAVIELSKSLFNVDVRNITINELLKADEVFITASNKEIMPVVAIDASVVGNGSPGQKTQKAMAAFRKFTGDFSNS